METDQTLQKVTEIETESRVNKILSLEQISLTDIDELSKEEERLLFERLTGLLRTLQGDEMEQLQKKLICLKGKFDRNQLWEYNHGQITWAISVLMQENGCMPSATDIATKTHLSRQTVHKHLKEYSSHPQYLGQVEQFRFMTSKVLAKVFQFAVNGDMSAAKLYFKMMGCINNEQATGGTLIQNQNNFIQINGTVLSQETIKHLNTEQLNTIEGILKMA
ncbi:MAG: hypothetical protein EAZ14_11450, partial [Runella slithyformis]